MTESMGTGEAVILAPLREAVRCMAPSTNLANVETLEDTDQKGGGGGLHRTTFQRVLLGHLSLAAPPPGLEGPVPFS